MALVPRVRQTMVLVLGYDAELRMMGVLDYWWAPTGKVQTRSRQTELLPLNVEELQRWMLDYFTEFVEEALRARDHHAPDRVMNELRDQYEANGPPEQGGRLPPEEATA